MAYGEGRELTSPVNLGRFAFFVLVWPMTGALTVIVMGGLNLWLLRVRPWLRDMPRHAVVVSLGLLVPEAVAWLVQRANGAAVLADIVLAIGLAAWLVLGYSRVAAGLMMANQVAGIALALHAKVNAAVPGFLFYWAIVAIVVVRLAVVALLALSWRVGFVRRDDDEDVVAEVFA